MCVSGWYVCECCWLAHHERALWLLGTLKNNYSSLILQCGSCKGGLSFFVKLVKQSLGSWSVLFSCFYMLSIWGIVSWALVYAIYLDSGIYVTKCNMGLGFLWKFDVVIGLYGLKKLRGEGCQWAQDREIRMIWPFRNLKPLFVEGGRNLGGHRIWIRWPHVHANG